MTDATGGKAFSTDVATIAAGATYSTASDDMITSGCKCIALTPYVTGDNAGSAGTITFNLVARVGENWCTTTWQAVTVVVSGTTKDVSPPIILNCPGIAAIRVSSIVNGDAAQAVTLLNINFASPRFFE